MHIGLFPAPFVHAHIVAAEVGVGECDDLSLGDRGHAVVQVHILAPSFLEDECIGHGPCAAGVVLTPAPHAALAVVIHHGFDQPIVERPVAQCVDLAQQQIADLIQGLSFLGFAVQL